MEGFPLDPALFDLLFGGRSAAAAPAAAVPPVVGPTEGPPAPFPPVQSLEPTNITSGFGAPKPIEDYMTQPASLGAALQPTAAGGGVPIPRPRPAEAPTSAAASATSQPNAILNALKGVQAPAAPQAQKVSTPHLPALRPVQGGGLFELLNALNLGQSQAFPGLKLPSTLGQALAGGR